MRNLLLTTALVLSVAAAQGQTAVSLDKAGTLAEKISSAEKYNITELKISGPLNGTDIILLRDMAGQDQENNVSEGKLEKLDLTNATIVKGGDPYYVSYSGSKDIEYYTTDNEMSNAMFFNCGKLKSVKLPISVTAIGDSCFYKCNALEDITIPEAVKEIRSYALSYTALPRFEFAKGMTIASHVLSGCSEMTEIIIPDDVTEISEVAFSGTGITTIKLPSKLKTIGSEAFSGSMLTSLECPEDLISIKDNAFARCKQLAEVKFNSKLEEIGKSAFSYCSFTEADVPNSVKTMGGAFGVCEKLTKVHLPEGLTTIEGSMFTRCPKLEEVNIPEGVTSIGSMAFQNNSSLKDLKLPEGLTTIGKSAFKGCSNFTEIKLPSTVESIGISCFDGCENATTIQLSPALKEIPRDAFGFCSSVTEIDIPEGVETIGDMAFMYCESITKLTLPSTLTSMSSSVFGGEEALEEIYCNAVTPPTCGRSVFADVPEDCVLYVPKGSKDAYANADTWSDFTNIKENGTTGINNSLKNTGNTYETERYNIAGQSVGRSYNGLQIIKYSDGRSVKVTK